MTTSTGAWGNWVVGAFSDYDFMDLHGNFTDGTFGLLGSEKESGAWAVGGRIGYLVTPAILFNGGWTETHFDGFNLVSGISGDSTGISLAAQTFNGGFIGGGTEVAIQGWPGLFWRSEYRYSSYRSANVPFVPSVGSFPFYEHETKNVQTITSSLVWKFNWFGH